MEPPQALRPSRPIAPMPTVAIARAVVDRIVLVAVAVFIVVLLRRPAGW
jgi:hypothetical protein